MIDRYEAIKLKVANSDDIRDQHEFFTSHAFEAYVKSRAVGSTINTVRKQRFKILKAAPNQTALKQKIKFLESVNYQEPIAPLLTTNEHKVSSADDSTAK